MLFVKLSLLLILSTCFAYSQWVFVRAMYKPIQWRLFQTIPHAIVFLALYHLITYPLVDRVFFHSLSAAFQTYPALLYTLLVVYMGKFYFRFTWLKAVFSTAFMLLVGIIFDFVSVTILAQFMDVNNLPTSWTFQIYSMASMSVVYILAAYLVSAFRSRNLVRQRGYAELSGTAPLISLWLFAFPLLLFVIMYCLFIDSNDSIASDYNYLFASTLFISIFILLLTIHIYYRRHQRKIYIQYLENEVKTLTNYTKTVDNLYRDIRHYKHDIQNILLSIRHFIDEEEYLALKDFYYTKVLDHSPATNHVYQFLTHMQAIGHTSLRGLVFSKIEDMTHKKIQFELELIHPIEEVAVDAVDLCRIVGILMDNAIESSVKSKERKVIFSVHQENGIYEIGISNTFEEKPDVKRMFQIDFTTKANHQGIGLHSLGTILNRYPNACLKYKVADHLFTQIIEIDNRTA